MNILRKIIQVVLAVAFAGGAFYSAWRATERQQTLEARLATLRAMDHQLSDVDRRMLEVWHREPSFDAVSRNWSELMRLRATLDGTPVAASLGTFDEALVHKDAVLEQFKSNQAVLRNARRSFLNLVARLMQHTPDETLQGELLALKADVLGLQLGEKDHEARARMRIITLGERAALDRDLALALLHAEQALDTSKRGEALLAAGLDAPARGQLKVVLAALERQRTELEQVLDTARTWMMIAILLLAGLLTKSVLAQRHRAAALAEALQSLKYEREAVELANHLLESRVTERTAELESRNQQLEVSLKQLEAARNQLVFSERMATVGTLAAGVAHEINNPAAYILTNACFIREELEALKPHWPSVPGATCADELVEASRAVEQGGKRIAQIVKDLKVFSRADDERVTTLDAREVVQLSAAMAGPTVKGRANLVVSLPKEPLPVSASSSRLGQVVLNLLVNAGQAIEEGNPGRNEVRVSATQRLGRVEIEVRDTGCGMSAEVKARIFDPFFTTKPVGVGTGLGLSICHSIVEQFKGTLSVESAPSEGSRFTVSLPLAEERLVEADGAALKPRSRRARVLVLDDEQRIRESIRRALSKEHDVTECEDVGAALGLIEAGKHFDLILCDLMMPGRNGADFYEELERKDPKLAERVFFVSGGATTDRTRTFIERLPERLMPKPLDVRALRELVATKWVH